MSNLIRYIPIALIAGYFIYANFSGSSSVEDDIDLNQVLDVTVETIYAYEDANQGQAPENEDNAFIKFGEDLAVNYNSAQPAIYKETISVEPQQDASLIAFVDKDANNSYTDGDEPLYMIEVDGENSRVIATSGSGAVGEHRISGSGFLTGYLIASMLSRQRASGVNSKSLASKKTQTSKQAARSRAGSGSHSRGK
jgi:hypothetical protein